MTRCKTDSTGKIRNGAQKDHAPAPHLDTLPNTEHFIQMGHELLAHIEDQEEKIKAIGSGLMDLLIHGYRDDTLFLMAEAACQPVPRGIPNKEPGYTLSGFVVRQAALAYARTHGLFLQLTHRTLISYARHLPYDESFGVLLYLAQTSRIADPRGTWKRYRAQLTPMMLKRYDASEETIPGALNVINALLSEDTQRDEPLVALAHQIEEWDDLLAHTTEEKESRRCKSINVSRFCSTLVLAELYRVRGRPLDADHWLQQASLCPARKRDRTYTSLEVHYANTLLKLGHVTEARKVVAELAMYPHLWKSMPPDGAAISVFELAGIRHYLDHGLPVVATPHLH